MRKLILIAALLWCAPALGADVPFGAGQGIGTLAGAIAAGNHGDNFIAYAPITETNQTVDFNLNNCTFVMAGTGDYVFDGSGATQDAFKISGTGNTFDFEGRFKITGYGRFVFWVTGAGNVINDPHVYANGYVGEATLYNYCLTTAANTINRPVIASTADNQGTQYGLYASATGGGAITTPLFQNITTTTGGANIYAFRANGNCGALTVSDAEVSGCSSGNRMYGFYWSSAVAASTARLRRGSFHDNVAAGTHYTLYSVSSGMDAGDVVSYGNTGGPHYAINITSTAAHNGNTHRVYNSIFSGSGQTIGFFLNQSVGNAPVVRNVIVRDATGGGFQVAANQPDSNNNLAYNNGTNYNGWTLGASDLAATDPGHVNAAGGDFNLLKSSVCIDSGAWIAGRTGDFEIQPVSGTAMDRGPYEFQQSNTRDVRTPLESGVVVPTRDER